MKNKPDSKPLVAIRNDDKTRFDEHASHNRLTHHEFMRCLLVRWESSNSRQQNDAIEAATK